MKKHLRLLLALTALLIVFPITSCQDDPEPPKPRDFLYGKTWYNKQGLGDYYFTNAGKYEYTVPWGKTTGSYMWYNELVDSMKVVQDGGGDWTIWFRSITEHQFTMSQSNENHANIYTYTDTK